LSAKKIALWFSLIDFKHIHASMVKHLLMKNKPTRAEQEEKRRQLEAQIAASKTADDAVDPDAQFYRVCFESAPYGIMVHDDNGRILVFNSQLEKISGYLRQEIPDVKTWIEKLYPDEEYRRLVIEERRKSASDKTRREKETIITSKDGNRHLCRFSSVLLDSGIRIVFIKTAGEQQHMVELLQESEDRFKLLSEAAIEGITIHKKGVLLRANRQFFEMFGYQPQELLGKQVIPLIFAKESVGMVREKIISGAETPYKAVGIKKDGTRFPIACHAKPLKYQGREVRVGAMRDLSYLDHAEQALQESEERFRELAENIHQVFWLFDWINQKVIYVSPAYENIWGRTVEALYKRYDEWAESIYKDDLAYAADSFARIAQTGESEIREYRIVRPDGSVRWISDKGFAINDESGNVYRIAGIAEDITESKLAQQALQESEEKFRTVAEQSPNMIFINKGGKVVYVNQKCEEMMGYKREEFYAPEFDFLTLIAPESIETIKSSFKKHQAGREIAPYEYSLISKKGEKIDVIITTKLIHFEGDQAILGIVTDITERKAAENALREKDKTLERQARHLEEVNTALKVLLEHREHEKHEMEENLLTNIKKLVFPYLEKLNKARLDPECQTYLDIIKSNLKDVMSPMASALSSNYLALTPTELQIADMIKHGKTSKEIAAMINVSAKAVAFHRGNIRKKLGLTNKKRNLRTHLQSFPQ